MIASRQPFQAFLDEHSQPVLSFLRAMVGPQEAEDVFQETFLAALRAYERMDGRHPRAWVMTIARRKAIDHHRARARRPEPRAELPEPRSGIGGGGGGGGASPPAGSGLALAPGAEDDADADADAGAMWKAVAELSAAQRAAIALRFVADLPYVEIGAALECSEGAARRRVSDGLRALRARSDQQIDREQQDDPDDQEVER